MAMSLFKNLSPMRSFNFPPMRGEQPPIFGGPKRPGYGVDRYSTTRPSTGIDVAPPKLPGMSPFSAPWNPKPTFTQTSKPSYLLTEQYMQQDPEYQGALAKFAVEADPLVKQYQTRYGAGLAPSDEYLAQHGVRRPKMIPNPTYAPLNSGLPARGSGPVFVVGY